MYLFTSDHHFLHPGIIQKTKRPFLSGPAMDQELMARLRAAEATGATLFHLGDFCFQPRLTLERLGGLERPEDHTLIGGNHDQNGAPSYAPWFGTMIGRRKRWRTTTHIVEDTLDGATVRVLLSHMAQEDLQGCDFNIHGHSHNSPYRPTPQHLNACVEWTDYRPVTLSELVHIHGNR